MYVIGLTGGIGSGKTAASDYFALTYDIEIVDADIVAREVVMQGQPTLAAIAAHFGQSVLQVDGSLDRAALRAIVFNNPEQRKKLESITHPAIRSMIQHKIAQSRSSYTLLVSPLLFESGQATLTQRNLVIDCDEQQQQQRASARDKVNAAQIKQIMAAQLPRQERLQRADDIAINNGDLKFLYQQLDQLHHKYLALAL
ncbi:MAG: dephospho-CoA kinase [Moraxellaceae bacterium]|nr:dephospho-CoA kinase [Pseudomonadales bacterium]MCP5175664.1 dephospho-CoA kinase [Moraxellaceae bacterium]MCP5175930.1 dephospho-CoA kinase [Moraxellaceae bacterium]HQV21525.1 dephospho-CoA kinase [Agitococcus sp.]